MKKFLCTVIDCFPFKDQKFEKFYSLLKVIYNVRYVTELRIYLFIIYMYVLILYSMSFVMN